MSYNNKCPINGKLTALKTRRYLFPDPLSNGLVYIEFKKQKIKITDHHEMASRHTQWISTHSNYIRFSGMWKTIKCLDLYALLGLIYLIK